MPMIFSAVSLIATSFGDILNCGILFETIRQTTTKFYPIKELEKGQCKAHTGLKSRKALYGRVASNLKFKYPELLEILVFSIMLTSVSRLKLPNRNSSGSPLALDPGRDHYIPTCGSFLRVRKS